MTTRLSAARVMTAAALAAALNAGASAQEATQPDQDPSTHQVRPLRRPNRLFYETSPYLLQHAYNPVDWYAWGPEAFEAARQQDKPIFLSVGYSTCYWCHVMERESFENEQTAALMNKHFISIKVDREERPDVDDVYMAGVQTLAGRGGWPMSLFLDPYSLKPFKGGTYFPPQPRYGKPSFSQLLQTVADQWRDRRQETLQTAERTAVAIRRRLSASYQPQPVNEADVERAVTMLVSGHDPEHGGFRRGRTKFPMPVNLELLLAAGWERPTVAAALRHTLDRMAMGGIYDQVGGGFHRYSTDRQWLIPHFEKMLYDNAQLASVYAKAYERTDDPFYGQIVRETLDYVLREMTGPEGGFYSAQDAEVNAREGASYVWTAVEVRQVLAAAGLQGEIAFVLQVYGLDRGGNFRDPHHPRDGLKNVLHLAQRPDELAAALGLSLEDFSRRLATIDAALLAARDLREQPTTDDKILTAWNGLMIAAMVDGARALDEPRYLEAARRTARFILENLQVPGGGLLRTYRAGQAKIDGGIKDYAHFIHGLIALHRAAGEQEWLDDAGRLAHEARERFQDERFGAYYDTLAGREDLLVRAKTTRDGVIPCGNSMMLVNLLDLHELTGDRAFFDDAARTVSGLSSSIKRSPVSTALATVALKRFVERYPGHMPGSRPAAAAGRQQQPVRVLASPRVVWVSREAPGRFEVTLKIADGYHVNAHEPGSAELVGLELRLVGQGLELKAAYPAGEPFRAEFSKDVIRVHEGTITVPVSLVQTGTVQGQPRVVLVYQVCTDQVCMQPQRVALPVKIAVSSKAR